MTARWSLLARSPALARSSHCLSVSRSGSAALYGGELKPRVPVDAEQGLEGAVHVFDLTKADSKGTASSNSWQTLLLDTNKHRCPEPRVGASSAIIDEHIYIWGGRGGTDMAPLSADSAGVWRCSLKSQNQLAWERLQAENEAAAPQTRSYHTMVSHADKLYIHAGCPTSGRLGDLYSFDVGSRKWETLASASEPGRGGTALAVTKLANADVFLRYAGFAGYELGADNTLDIYDIGSNAWRTVVPGPDPQHGRPGPRSVHGFVGFQSSKLPDAIALLYHGERDASSLGHAGAGTFWDDVWVLQEKKSQGPDELQWKFIPVDRDGPSPRGWFPPASWTSEKGETKVVMQGGLLSSNERSDELWMLDIV